MKFFINLELYISEFDVGAKGPVIQQREFDSTKTYKIQSTNRYMCCWLNRVKVVQFNA